MNISDRLKRETEYANDVLKRYAAIEEEGYQKTVMEAMNYSLDAGGKRLRPVFMKGMYDLFGGKDKYIEPFMAAIELIHTYSLVHDDLPSLDNDMYRRGKKTTHAVYGENLAILTGDALLNRAFETASKTLLEDNDTDMIKRKANALNILAQKAGIYGMAGGQVYDVEAENKGINLDKEGLDFIFRLKTGALIESSMMIGAVLAGAKDEETAIVEKIGTNTGMAFQIRDDILDVTGNEEELGKPVGSDERNNKITYVTLYGIERSKEDVREYSDRAIKLLKSLGRDSEFMEGLILSLVERNK
ncbi:MAG: polyprenyl synthetase family protein [Lachnospiraceae bacterium]|nr:polyprenyl synthetase family protein [Lachnospiraceae bacterium]